ncbi:substrate-binding domain-containing protein [Frigoriglobus tundricola]|uniref:Sugar ABC transporter n=1 Tax=Frigoriglobus tundricola TaxID=2774151 RepID=A0A6M5Z5W3_9BACT|nr:substrate-binding domain-containing protein [Frigoriglobus tundricola]QJX00653.1 Sugar ABC transporter [Frigoriglobus tundricola]
MSSILRVSVLVGLAAVLACVPACGKKDTGKIKIGVVTNCTDPFWDLCEAGAKKAAQEFDVEVLFRQPEGLDVAKQMPIVEAFVQQGVKGIAISVINPKGQKKDLTRIAAEVPLITMDNDADADTGRLCYIGVDNKEAGRAVGRLVKKSLPPEKGGTIAMFIGSDVSANGTARTQGVLDELATPDANGTAATRKINGKDVPGKMYGKYFLVDGEAKTDGGPEKNPQQYPHAMLGRLENVPDVCLIGLYAYNPPAILSAVKSKELVGKVKIVGFDENPVTLRAVAAGEVEGTVVQDPYNYGYKSVEVLAAVARGDKSKMPSGSLSYQVVTKDGGPDETINGLHIKFPRAADYENVVKAQFASIGK